MLLQSHRDTVRIAISNAKPTRTNVAFHELGGAGRETMLPIPFTRESVWVLAMTDRSALTLTEYPFEQAVMSDSSGRRVAVSQAGEMLVGERRDDVSINFQYGVSSFDVRDVNDVTGTGAVGQVGSMVAVSTGTGVGSAMLESLDAVRYRSGRESYCMPSVVFAEPEVNVNQYAGFLNDLDGFALGYQGLDAGLWFIKGGAVSFVAQVDWNIDVMDGSGESSYDMDLQTGQVPELKYVWHGIKNLTLEITSEEGHVLPCHKFKFINEAVDTHLDNPSLPVAVKIERTTGVGADLRILTGSWRAGVVTGGGEASVSDRWFSITNLEQELVSAARTVMFVIRSKSIYRGKNNHTLAGMAVIDLVNNGNKDVVVYGSVGGTVAGGGAFVDVDTDNSVLEIAKGGTVTGGKRGRARVLKAGATLLENVKDQSIRIRPGEDLVVEIDPGGPVNGTFTASIDLVEFH